MLLESIPKKPRWYGELIAIISGALLVLAFAPFNLFVLSILSPLSLLFLWHQISPKRAFQRGFLFGMGLFGVGISWVYISLYVYGQAHAFLAIALTLGLVVVMAFFPAALGYLLNRFFPANNVYRYIFAFPALWTLLEWVRTWFLSGFPWLFLGYSQLNSPLRGLAPVLSVYGVSWAVTVSCGLIFVTLTIHRVKSVMYALLGLLILWSCAYSLDQQKWTYETGQPIPVRMVQGNIPQELKWQPKQAEESFELYQKLTDMQLAHQLIIWPEAAITLDSKQIDFWLSSLNQQLKSQKSTLITGIPLSENGKFYNAMVVLGEGSGVYRKHHLVPFGEYMPLRFLLAWLNDYIIIPMSDFTSGASQQPPMKILGDVPVSGSICYEIAYPMETLKNLQNSQFMVVVSDDSWFGESIAPAQHAQMAQMRALETGRYVLMSSNNAITAIMNERGQVQVFAPPFEQAVLIGKVQPMQGQTPWVRIGIYPILAGLFLSLLMAWWLGRKAR